MMFTEGTLIQNDWSVGDIIRVVVPGVVVRPGVVEAVVLVARVVIAGRVVVPGRAGVLVFVAADAAGTIIDIEEHEGEGESEGEQLFYQIFYHSGRFQGGIETPGIETVSAGASFTVLEEG